MPGSPEPPSASSWEVHPYGRHRKKQTQAAGEITETKTLDAGNRLPELTAKQQMLYFCSRSLACGHNQTIPWQPWCEGPVLEIKSHKDVLLLFLSSSSFLIFLLHCMACGILAGQRGIKHTPSALEAWNLNHWTTRKSLDTVSVSSFRPANY